MRLIGSDPDIKTIVTRIDDDDIDLQPEFQRGEVWSDSKKQRLIDSILREWHVPPIHVIEVTETSKQEVLDGQQRLVSIRDFVKNLFVIDGTIEPLDDEIAKLDGLRYHQLPEHWRRRFDQFTLRVFRIIDYRPGEPGELFYRLNQPTNLTAAEQRNAFFGPARQQIKHLVQLLENAGGDKDLIGFSNSRMAYDDVLARLCITLETGTLREKVTANVLASRYRSEKAFDDEIFYEASRTIELLTRARPVIVGKVKFNKATLYSWLYFLTRASTCSALAREQTAQYIEFFESLRSKRAGQRHEVHGILGTRTLPWKALTETIDVYNDRATARVNDISSVLSRDVALWSLFFSFLETHGLPIKTETPQIRRLKQASACIEPGISGEDFVQTILHAFEWEPLP